MRLDEVDEPEGRTVTVDRCQECDREYQYPCGPPRNPGTCPRSDCDGDLIRTRKEI